MLLPFRVRYTFKGHEKEGYAATIPNLLFVICDIPKGTPFRAERWNHFSQTWVDFSNELFEAAKQR